jgi:hypothetical protein
MRLRPLIVACVLAACALAPAAAQAHKGDPHYLSVVRRITPAVPGLAVTMLSRNDRLLVTNRGPRTIVFQGYDGEPYLRFRADGTVQENQLSPATYLNVDATGRSPVPAIADADADPRWKTVSRDGRFEFHDHRIHWMGEHRPPIVTDPDKKTKVVDWRVPFDVAGEATPGAVAGTLYWTPLGGGGAPVAAIVVLVLLVVGGVALVVLVRRRRRSDPADEAW